MAPARVAPTKPRSLSDAPVRRFAIGSNAARFEERADGALFVRPVARLGRYPEKLTTRFAHFAALAPDRIFMAERDSAGAWRKISYAEAFDAAKRIGAGLIRRGLSAERPVMILSGNDLEHALLAIACLHVGAPYAPISPAYSTIATDLSKLRHIAGRLTPGLIFASDGAVFARALEGLASHNAEIVVARNPPLGGATLFADLLAGAADEINVAQAHEAIKGEDVAKILFTSGSTALPKGVINSQRMLTANQEMIANYFRFLKEEPPVLVDWLPWSHTFGGNHNFGLVIYNGGSFYIDEGRPTPKGIEATVRNLREIATTAYFNVPKGFEELAPRLAADRPLRDIFFSRLNMNFFAGAGLSQHVWDAIDAASVEALGARVLMMTGLGSTETGPFALACAPEHCQSGYLGLPVPGVELKLTPVEGKFEARVRGAAITQGYWRDPAATAKAFDEEGWYRMGDALRFIDDADRAKGFKFDGRIAEDFKLSTGTWVSVGPLRAKIVSHFAPLVRDVVIAGLDYDDIAVLVFPDIDNCRALCGDHSVNDVSAILSHPRLVDEFRRRLDESAATATGSSNRVNRLLLLDEPPSLDRGEITDKGSINQRAVLGARSSLVEELYQLPRSPRVISAGET
ncbi:MAG TPA: feruloyl-CoA synthase [Roseiarcus sp.]|nr:feruloyl-CoA synthase [Roseiarcus sp.]